MEELIFFAVIIFFSIIESIARSRKQKKGQRQGEREDTRPELPDAARWEQRFPDYESPGEGVATYDEDLSYDDRARGGIGTRPQPTQSPPPRPTSSRPSSDVLLPGDLLAELERLAGKKQETRARTLELPKESPPIPEQKPVPASRPTTLTRKPLPSQVARPAPVEHTIHLAHAGYGTDPSSRARSREDALDPLAETMSRDAAAVYRQLRSRSPSELRRAMILREVLGRPVVLRE